MEYRPCVHYPEFRKMRIKGFGLLEEHMFQNWILLPNTFEAKFQVQNFIFTRISSCPNGDLPCLPPTADDQIKKMKICVLYIAAPEHRIFKILVRKNNYEILESWANPMNVLLLNLGCLPFHFFWGRLPFFLSSSSIFLVVFHFFWGRL